MKNILLVLGCLFALDSLAQSIPFNINYQAVVRDIDGRPLPNLDVDATINILKGDSNGPIVFTEQHNTTTNDFGLYFIMIGDGNGQDDLKDIDWAESEYYIETVLSVDGGTEMIDVSKLNSVPYSFISYKSVVDQVEDEDSDISNELQNLSLNGTQLEISQGNSVDLKSIAGLGEETQTSMSLNFNGTSIDYIDERGTTTNLDLCHIVNNCVPSGGSGEESLTEIRLNFDGKSIDYLDEDGVTTNLHLCHIVDNCESLTELTYNSATNSLEYLDENGKINIIKIGSSNSNGGEVLEETVTEIRLNFNGTSIDYKDEDGVTTNLDLCNVVDNCETVTTMVDNGDGTYSYFNEDGAQTIIKTNSNGGGNLNETVTEIRLNFNGTSIDYIDERGTTTNLDLCNVVDNCETVTNLIDNGDGTYAYINEEGNLTIIDVIETVTTFVDNGDGTFTYTSEDGTLTYFSETTTSLIESSSRVLKYTDEDGNSTEIDLLSIKEDDPDDSSKVLAYAPISGAENAIFERGIASLSNGELYIAFSDHFKKLLSVDGMTVSLTPHSADTYGLAVIEKNEDGIRVKELMNGTSNMSFDWEVKATRKSQLSYQVIRDK